MLIQHHPITKLPYGDVHQADHHAIGLVICGLVALLDYCNDLVLCCAILCAFPIDVGILCVFCTLIRLPNVGQGYNEQSSLFNYVIHCAPMFPMTYVSLGRAYTALLPLLLLFLELRSYALKLLEDELLRAAPCCLHT